MRAACIRLSRSKALHPRFIEEATVSPPFHSLSRYRFCSGKLPSRMFLLSASLSLEKKALPKKIVAGVAGLSSVAGKFRQGIEPTTQNICFVWRCKAKLCNVLRMGCTPYGCAGFRWQAFHYPEIIVYIGEFKANYFGRIGFFAIPGLFGGAQFFPKLWFFFRVPFSLNLTQQSKIRAINATIRKPL